MVQLNVNDCAVPLFRAPSRKSDHVRFQSKLHPPLLACRPLRLLLQCARDPGHSMELPLHAFHLHLDRPALERSEATR